MSVRKIIAAAANSSLSSSTSIPTDPFFANVTLFVNGSGLGGSTTITDLSSSPKTLTSNGTNSVAINTNIKKYGTGSVAFDGNSNLTNPIVSTNLIGLNNDFTVEGWIYPNGAQGPWKGICGNYLDASYGARSSWALGFDGNGSNLSASIATANGVYVGTGLVYINPNVWTHFAFVRNGSTFNLYVNGTATTPFTFAGSIYDGGSNFELGSYINGAYRFVGYIDDFRITKGIARYTANFTVPDELIANSVTSSFTTTNVEDVFSTNVYIGNASTNAIVNNIDLLNQGGLVWLKNRINASTNPTIFDTSRTTGYLYTNNQNSLGAGSYISYGSLGFTLTGVGADGVFNINGVSEVAWTFRRAAKFFDMVTYAGDGATTRGLTHSLNALTGMIIVKSTTTAGDWGIWHRSFPTSNVPRLLLNSSAATTTPLAAFVSAPTTDTSGFLVSNNGVSFNTSGSSYIAYLFAHDPSATGKIYCDSFTTDASGVATVTIGWEPQFLLLKSMSGSSSWFILDDLRLMNDGASSYITADTGNAEGYSSLPYATATGFQAKSLNASQTYIYVAIRRSFTTPTSGAKVFNTVLNTGSYATKTISGVGFSPDLVMSRGRANSHSQPVMFQDKLRGLKILVNNTNLDSAIADSILRYTNDGMVVGADGTIGAINFSSGVVYSAWCFKRATGFFDIVRYTGNGTNNLITHNLGVQPELVISKSRSQGNSVAYGWNVYFRTGSTWTVFNGWTSGLNLTTVPDGTNVTINSSATQFDVYGGGYGYPNDSGSTHILYLFATVANVSSIGSYIGNGSSMIISCGFAAGARFILIRRLDSAGDWYIWDSARGIIGANDPYIAINTSNAEVTTDDSIDPDNSGFIVNQNSASNINALSAKYMFFAIA